MTHPHIFTSFKRSQVASLTATAVDFGSLVCLVEVLHFWYVAATAVGALLGALTNFALGRHWSFEASHGGIHGQAFRYMIVSGMSLLLNSAGVYFFTEFLEFKYFVSKMIVALCIGIFFNFPLHKIYVFR